MGLERTLLNHSSRVSGAAPIRESTKKYFESLGLFISELYGSTETSGPISTILEKRKLSFILYSILNFRIMIFFFALARILSFTVFYFVANHNCDATCGKSFNGMQVEIMDPDFVSGDGEIVIHSRNVFMGYAKVLDEIEWI